MCGASLQRIRIRHSLTLFNRRSKKERVRWITTCKGKSETALFGHWKVCVASRDSHRSRALNNVDRCRLIGMVLIGGQPRGAFVSLMRRRIISDISRALYRFARNTRQGNPARRLRLHK